MKKLFLALLMMSGFLLTSHAQDCKDIQTGSFKIANESGEYLITRTNKHQFEEVRSIGLKMQFDLKWTSECSYELSNPKVLEGEGPVVDKTQKVFVRIVEVSDKSYTADVTSNFGDEKITMKIEIVKRGN